MISKLTCSAVLIFFFISASNLSTQTLHFDKLKLKESFQRVEFSIDSLNDSNNVNLTEKSPFLAGSLSFIVPGFGLGQLYNGQLNKFIKHAGISAGCILLIYLGFEFEFIKVGINNKGKNEGLFVTVFLLYLGNWIWSVVDAVISANNINKKVRLQKNRTHKIGNIRFGFGLDRNKNLNLRTVIYF